MYPKATVAKTIKGSMWRGWIGGRAPIRLLSTAHVTSPTPQATEQTLMSIPKLDWSRLTPQQQTLIRQLVRVNQAGELGAVRIYQGQLSVLQRSADAPALRKMLKQERVHFETFNQVMAVNGIRPTALTPLWNVAGWALGAGTALLGREGAMMCTEAVETVIGQHYNDQLRELADLPADQVTQLRQICRRFRDEELEHLDHAVESGNARQAPFHGLLSAVIQTGCRVAIAISKRI